MTVKTSNWSVDYTINLPFSFSLSGAVTKIDSASPKAWRDRVITLLATHDYERVWYQHFGAGLLGHVFEPETVAAINATEAVSEMFIRWLPELTLQSADSSYDPDSGSLILTIIYSLPTGEEDSVKISTDDISPSGDIVKVTTNG